MGRGRTTNIANYPLPRNLRARLPIVPVPVPRQRPDASEYNELSVPLNAVHLSEGEDAPEIVFSKGDPEDLGTACELRVAAEDWELCVELSKTKEEDEKEVLALVRSHIQLPRFGPRLYREVFAIEFGVAPLDQEQPPPVWTVRFDGTTDEQVMWSKRVWSLISSAFKVSPSECAKCLHCTDWRSLVDV
jgi:hypothetical protein